MVLDVLPRHAKSSIKVQHFQKCHRKDPRAPKLKGPTLLQSLLCLLCTKLVLLPPRRSWEKIDWKNAKGPWSSTAVCHLFLQRNQLNGQLPMGQLHRRSIYRIIAHQTTCLPSLFVAVKTSWAGFQKLQSSNLAVHPSSSLNGKSSISPRVPSGHSYSWHTPGVEGEALAVMGLWLPVNSNYVQVSFCTAPTLG